MLTKQEFIDYLNNLQFEIERIIENIDKAKADITILENTISNTLYNIERQQ